MLTPTGNVFTPPGFQIFSAQGVVQLTWNQAPLATAYAILRSTDNVTFTSIGTTASLSYNDSTGTVGTIYYYQVQASQTISGVLTYSLPTVSLSGVSLKPGQETAGNLILEAQQRTDKVNSQFYTAQELMSMCSKSYKELYDLITESYGSNYYMKTPYTFTTSGTIDPTYQASVYPLPDDFYKGLGAEVCLNPNDPNSWITIKRFNFVQRNLWNYPNVYTFYGITNLRYSFEGSQLWIVPIPSQGQTIRIWYAPRPNQLLNVTDTIDGVSGWEEYIVVDMAMKMLQKEESDVSVFAAQKAALEKRIIEAAANRNIGDAETVSDSKLRNFAWSDDNWNGGMPW